MSNPTTVCVNLKARIINGICLACGDWRRAVRNSPGYSSRGARDTRGGNRKNLAESLREIHDEVTADVE